MAPNLRTISFSTVVLVLGCFGTSPLEFSSVMNGLKKVSSLPSGIYLLQHKVLEKLKLGERD